MTTPEGVSQPKNVEKTVFYHLLRAFSYQIVFWVDTVYHISYGCSDSQISQRAFSHAPSDPQPNILQAHPPQNNITTNKHDCPLEPSPHKPMSWDLAAPPRPRQKTATRLPSLRFPSTRDTIGTPTSDVSTHLTDQPKP